MPASQSPCIDAFIRELMKPVLCFLCSTDLTIFNRVHIHPTFTASCPFALVSLYQWDFVTYRAPYSIQLKYKKYFRYVQFGGDKRKLLGEKNKHGVLEAVIFLSAIDLMKLSADGKYKYSDHLSVSVTKEDKTLI
ncbi:uncharacterized protein EKO05_0002763 [Ascochyta rabiei]|uniref:uncharacterized protein n=1 Tax=Didymella rabiei TaxID=5454 RepID=UPI00220349DB|nr:uncharacterized protein EKO05_0002763 [Ascochyta rabiei]UPX12200.1 hypothetical protein EKO05_0002763 [Ascochyta rabiei]